jgi:hypothetical protein
MATLKPPYSVECSSYSSRISNSHSACRVLSRSGGSAQTVTTTRAPNAGSMPAYRDKLTDQAIAAVASYIRNSWGNAAPAIDADQVAKARAAR